MRLPAFDSPAQSAAVQVRHTTRNKRICKYCPLLFGIPIAVTGFFNRGMIGRRRPPRNCLEQRLFSGSDATWWPTCRLTTAWS